MGYGRYKDEDHNLIAAIESALSGAMHSVEEALDSVSELEARNPDKEVQIAALRDDIYGLYSVVENTDFGSDIHEMLSVERGEEYWEDSDD